MVKLKINKLAPINIPTSWAECDRAIVSALLELRYQPKGEQWYADAASLLLPNTANELLSANDTIPLAQHLQWIWEEDVLQYDAINGIVVNGASLQVPKKGMYNVTGAEWIDGNGYLIAHQKGIANMIEHAIAVYCRPMGEAYNIDAAKKNAQTYVTGMSDVVKVTLLAYIIQETDRVIQNKSYARIFPEPVEGQAVKTPAIDVWYDFMIDAAKLKNLGGDYDVTVAKPIHLILKAVTNEMLTQDATN